MRPSGTRRGPGTWRGPGTPGGQGTRGSGSHGVVLAALLVLAAGCAGRGAEGSAGGTPAPAAGYGGVPDLAGRSVLLLPAQSVAAGLGNPDPEIAFSVQERAGRVRWVLPTDLRQALSRSPGVQSDPDRLPVGMFLRAEVRRVGDPLYGDLRRLGALVSAETALIPVAVRHRVVGSEGEGVVEISAALIDIRSGRVHWFGAVEGEPGALGAPGPMATAAAALVRRVAP